MAWVSPLAMGEHLRKILTQVSSLHGLGRSEHVSLVTLGVRVSAMMRLAHCAISSVTRLTSRTLESGLAGEGLYFLNTFPIPNF